MTDKLQEAKETIANWIDDSELWIDIPGIRILKIGELLKAQSVISRHEQKLLDMQIDIHMPKLNS